MFRILHIHHIDSLRARLEHLNPTPGRVWALQTWVTSESAKKPDSNRVKMARVNTRPAHH